MEAAKGGRFRRHALLTVAVAAIAAAAWYLVAASPAGSIWVEAEGAATGRGWVYMDDVNLSGSRGIMSYEDGPVALISFDVDTEGEYALWFRYFGNYGEKDLDLWRRAYTNNFRFIDYNGGTKPLAMSVSIDASEAVEIPQEGSHGYGWARVITRLGRGPHALAISKADASPGSVNLDGVLITGDLGWRPRWLALRQASGVLAPLLIIAFPVAVWLFLRRTGHLSVLLWYSGLAAVLLSVMWIDTDGGFWIWLTQNAEFTLKTIYTKGDALHHRYVYPPPIAAMLIALRPVFGLLGAMDGITPTALILSKAVVLPFFIGTAVLLERLEGWGAALLWAANPITIFTAAANSFYFVMGIFLTLCVLFTRSERHYLSAFSFGLALASMPAAGLLLVPYLLLLRGFTLQKALTMAALAAAPSFLVLLPYQFIDPAGLEARVMGAGLATWMPMHLGLMLGNAGVTALLYAALTGALWVARPPYTAAQVSGVFALAALAYLHIGAPYFLAWTVAFQPFVIIMARRLNQELFYSIYMTALMAWGSFAQNTGGAIDRAGETGFFPFYNFYTWPFDGYSALLAVYGRARFFARAELEALAHSLSAGLSVVLFALILKKVLEGKGNG